ncbi:MAG TPA: GntR family transcriptional regulator [Stellaceae bacterium]|nr:GntR family transcriptional regulator [Stellaceae bacterium]
MNDSGAVSGPDFRPLYAQVRELIIGRMLRGDWRPGDILPSEGRLAAEFGVSQGTVRKALDEMAAQNLVVRRQGLGTFIARHSQQHALFHFFHIRDERGVKELPTGRVLQLRQRKAERAEARRLDLPPRSAVWAMRRLRALRGKPVILERIALPAALFPGLELPLGRDLPDELYVLYQQRFGITVVRAEEKLRAVAADALDAKSLGVAEGTPLLEIDRLARGLDGRPVEWRLSRCNSAHHHYYSEIE